jgi:dipeptidase D
LKCKYTPFSQSFIIIFLFLSQNKVHFLILTIFNKLLHNIGVAYEFLYKYLTFNNMEFNLNILEPKTIWHFFQEISGIPRPSGKTQAIQDWLLDFARKHGLEGARDDAGNVLIRKPASAGFENVKSIVMQSHMDMVCEKNSDIDHDFEKDPIQMWIDGEWLKAKGTTLGADNGIGIAAQLAILDDNTLQHGTVECLFTADEETGLYGAYGLKPGFFEGKRLINLDSEDEGEIFIGCAGGMNSQFKFNYETEPAPKDYFYFKVSIKGLLGGHSGDDIDKGRGNANHILARFLWKTNSEFDLRLHDYKGGNLSNAIPREATFIAGVPYSLKEEVRVKINMYQSDLEDEFGPLEPKLVLELESQPVPDTVLKKNDSNRFISALYACPTGVIAMSYSIPGLVETSLNLASVKQTAENEWTITTSQRSSIESAKYALSDRLQALFTMAGFSVSHGEGYPGWKPNPDSDIVRLVFSTYKELFNEDAKIKAIHAGLECGLFLDKYPGLDMVSFGPTMRGVHSPDERLNIPSVGKFWDLLVATLSKLD